MIIGKSQTGVSDEMVEAALQAILSTAPTLPIANYRQGGNIMFFPKTKTPPGYGNLEPRRTNGNLT
jgi:hypothetical protein